MVMSHSSKVLLLTLTSALFFVSISGIPIDNGVEGEPEVECGPATITVNFNVRNPFDGHVYVKGLYDNDACRSDETGRSVAGITLPFDSCNVARTRSLNPRGIYVTTTIVISFHPQFVTKVDRAYRIQCFYMEADKTVSVAGAFEVSDITTIFQTQLVPMPICKYEYGVIGQQIYHKWTCDTETVNTFCAVVHSCFVDDGQGDTVQILDADGCALDKYLLNNLEYPTDLTAGQEAHVYKYADREQLFYQCQISITIKEPNGECPRPKCTEPTAFGATKVSQGTPTSNVAKPPQPASPRAPVPPTNRATTASPVRLLRKRSLSDHEDILDVRTQFDTLDISEQIQGTPENLTHLLPRRYDMPVVFTYHHEGLCLSYSGFSLLVGFTATLTATSIVVVLFVRRHSKTT